MRLLFFLVFGLVVWMEGAGQPPSRFYTAFGGDGDDIGHSIKTTLDGQYIIAGSSTSYFTNGQADVYLTKVDSMGFPMWQKFIGGILNDVGK
jgi:hypothetical protein